MKNVIRLIIRHAAIIAVGVVCYFIYTELMA